MRSVSSRGTQGFRHGTHRHTWMRRYFGTRRHEHRRHAAGHVPTRHATRTYWIWHAMTHRILTRTYFDTHGHALPQPRLQWQWWSIWVTVWRLFVNFGNCLTKFLNFGKIWLARFYFDTLILLISYAKIHNSKISVSSMKNLKLGGILCINSTQFSAYETMSGPLQNHPCTLGTPRGILETVNQNTWMSSTKLKFSRSFWGAEQA